MKSEDEARSNGSAGPEALADLSIRHRRRLVAHAHRVTGDHAEAEDVVQEVYLRARAARPASWRSMRAWLHAVSYRIAIDRVRARKRRVRALVPAARRLETPEEPCPLERAERAARVRDAVARLEEPHRTALTLRYLDGLEFPEIAARMGTIERTARTWVGRGLTRLRERMKGEEE